MVPQRQIANIKGESKSLFGNHADLDRVHLAFTMSNNEEEDLSISNYLPSCVDECYATLLDWCRRDRWQRKMP